MSSSLQFFRLFGVFRVFSCLFWLFFGYFRLLWSPVSFQPTWLFYVTLHGSLGYPVTVMARLVWSFWTLLPLLLAALVQTVLVRWLTVKFGLSKGSFPAVTVNEQTFETTCSQIVEMLVSILFLIAGFCKFPPLRWPAYGPTRGKCPPRRHPCFCDKHISKNDNFLTSNILSKENLHCLACYQLPWQPCYLFRK